MSPLVRQVVSLWVVVALEATVPPEADLILSCQDSDAAVRADSRIPTWTKLIVALDPMPADEELSTFTSIMSLLLTKVT